MKIVRLVEVKDDQGLLDASRVNWTIDESRKISCEGAQPFSEDSGIKVIWILRFKQV